MTRKEMVWTAGIVIALLVFGFLFSIVGSKDYIPLINGLLWPTVVVIAMVTFRKPLADFLKGIAQRVTKFSITQFFAVELSLPEVPNLRLDQLDEWASKGVKELLSEPAADSGAGYLLMRLKDEKSLESLIIDLGTGKEWLTSRLFLFAVMLQDLLGLRCIVFVETRGDICRRFVGTATPNEIRRAFAGKYPWLEQAYIGVHIKPGTVPPKPAEAVAMQDFLDWQTKFLDQIQLIGANIQFANTFLDSVRVNPAIVPNQDKEHPPVPDKRREWVFLKNKKFWEHAHWIDRDSLKDDLRDALQNSDDAWLNDPPGTPQAKRVQEILCRKCSFVALVDEDRVFKSLVDREALLEQIAEHAGTASDDQ